MFAHKVISGKMPKNLTEEYNTLRSYGNNRSSVKGNLKIPKHRTAKYENSVLYRTVKTWNKTDIEIRTNETGTFKKKLQAMDILQKYTN